MGVELVPLGSPRKTCKDRLGKGPPATIDKSPAANMASAEQAPKENE